MARRNIKLHNLGNFIDGVDYDSSPFDVPKTCLIKASNVLPSTSVGGISSRNGIKKLNSVALPAAVTGIVSWYLQGGATENFNALSGGKWYRNSPEGTWADITGSLVLTSDANNLLSSDVLTNILYNIDRKGDTLWKDTGSGNGAVVSSGALYTVAIAGAGTSYVVGDILTVTGGGGSGGQVKVTGIGAGGAVTTIALATDANGFPIAGSGYAVTASAATTGGTGFNFLLNIQAISNPPNGTFLVAFNYSIFIGGNATNPLLLYFSDSSNGNAYGASNYLNFDQGKGSKLTGAVIRAFAGDLVVFKDKSIHLVETTGTIPAYTKFVFVDGIGCISHQSIVTLPGGEIMWWDSDDIYMMIGNSVISATKHPKTKNPRMRNFFRSNVNQSRLQYVCGVYYPALDIVRWFYSTPNSSYNNAHIDYHVKLRSFWPGTLRGTSCCTRLIQGGSRIYAGDTNGFVYRQDFGNDDDGSAIVWDAQIPWQAHEGTTIRKKMDLFYVTLNKSGNYNVQADVFLNQSSVAEITNGVLETLVLSGAQYDVDKWDVGKFANEGNLIEGSLLVNRLYKTISVDIHGSGIDTPVNIYDVTFMERPLEVTRRVN